MGGRRKEGRRQEPREEEEQTAVEGEHPPPSYTPSKYSPRESRNHCFAGAEGLRPRNGDPGQVGAGTTDFTHSHPPPSPHPQLDMVTPARRGRREVTFSLCLLSRLASLPSPLIWGVAKPPPSSPLPGGKPAPSQAASPLCHVWAKAAGSQLPGGVGVGGWDKDRAFLLPNPKQGGLLPLGERRKKGEAWAAPPPGFLQGGGAGGCPLTSSRGPPAPLGRSDWACGSGLAGEGRAEVTGDSCPLSPRAI